MGPAYLRSESGGINATIRYRLADVEAWEDENLVVPGTGCRRADKSS
jgi:hypothetical protein